MPHVTIVMRQGRTVEQKREMVKGITGVLVNTIGAKPDMVTVHIHELSDDNLAREGVLLSDRV